eukprot:PLAT9434.1.p1 GENE.PLAT9434.1~~PLAT9434.1.p1  ORF type:complete len:548 (-),score=274.68 PLAT9434.1:636-2084(-)
MSSAYALALADDEDASFGLFSSPAPSLMAPAPLKSGSDSGGSSLLKAASSGSSGGGVVDDTTQGPPVYKIVLTGGPCGGKTTCMSKLRDRLESLGYLVMLVPESATLLFSAGAPRTSYLHSPVEFQSSLMRLQIALEDEMEAIAIAQGRPAVLLCDRGTMDSKAYLDDHLWEMVVEDLGRPITTLRDQRYDAVVHLVTAADGASQFYTTANNATRTEGVDEAIALDRRLLTAWIGHEHVFIIDNSTDFASKVRRALNRVCGIVGVPQAGHRQLKYELAHLPRMSDFPPELAVEIFTVKQTYVRTKTGIKARVRKKTQGGSSSYLFQSWVPSPDGSGEHVLERHISNREYLALLKNADPHAAPVRKQLWCFIWDNVYYELNIFEDGAVLEIESVKDSDTNDDVINVPPFLQVARDVTNNPEFDSLTLARRIAAAKEERARLQASRNKNVPAAAVAAAAAAAAAAASAESSSLHDISSDAPPST